MTILRRMMVAASLALMMSGIAFAQTKPDTGNVPAKDAAAIDAAMKVMFDGWNNHDMKAFVSQMTDDVEWVNVVGMWWRGKAQVFQAHEAFHKTIFRNRQAHDAEKIVMRAIAPDAVVVTSITRTDGFTSPSGHVEPAGRSMLTEVFVKRDGKWLVAEGHNTTIVEAAQASNPVKE